MADLRLGSPNFCPSCCDGGCANVGVGPHLNMQTTARAARTQIRDRAILGIVVTAFVAPYQLSQSSGLSAKSEAHWTAFEPDRIPRLIAEGKTVFVDITAEWCITCQVNKTLTSIGAASMRSPVADSGRHARDWTRPDAKISAYLKSFGRFGIPLNAVYGPQQKRCYITGAADSGSCLGCPRHRLRGALSPIKFK